MMSVALAPRWACAPLLAVLCASLDGHDSRTPEATSSQEQGTVRSSPEAETTPALDDDIPPEVRLAYGRIQRAEIELSLMELDIAVARIRSMRASAHARLHAWLFKRGFVEKVDKRPCRSV